MMGKKYKRWIHKYRKQLIRKLHKPTYAIGLFVFCSMLSLILVGMNNKQDIHATELLNLIARAESRSNYNAYFGNPNNTSVDFTSMTVGEVQGWQKQFVAAGNASSAVGRYQFIDSTLESLVQQLNINKNDLFDEGLQDSLAVALLERRGVREYVDNKMSRETFAHNLSKEWAGLPKATGDHPEQSYYAGDGLNKAQISVEEVLASIATVRKLSL